MPGAVRDSGERSAPDSAYLSPRPAGGGCDWSLPPRAATVNANAMHRSFESARSCRRQCLKPLVSGFAFGGVCEPQQL